VLETLSLLLSRLTYEERAALARMLKQSEGEGSFCAAPQE
jgi:hypothetical protein